MGPAEHVAGDRRRARVHAPVQVCRERVERASAAVGGREAGRFPAQDHLVQGLHLARTGERGREAEAPRRYGALELTGLGLVSVFPLLYYSGFFGWTTSSTSGV